MRWLLRIGLGLLSALFLGAVALFAGLGPVAVLPGGVLLGPVVEPPEDWSFTDAIAEVQVQTHVGPLPWTVTTWVLSDRGELFLAAGECDRVWTNRVEQDPDVRVRMDGDVYELRATLETDRAVGARLAPVVLHKYFGIAVETANWIDGETRGCVFRLEPRP